MTQKRSRLNFLSARKTYEKKTKAQRAVAIAKDALRILNNTKMLKVEQGIYIDLDGTKYYDPVTTDARKFIRETIKSTGRPCAVCAKGALLVTKVLAKDKLPLKDIGSWISRNPATGKPLYSHINASNSQCTSNLNDAFDENTLDYIEFAFEGRTYGSRSVSMPYDDTYGWLHKYPVAKERLIAILRRLITNNGIFTEKDVRQP